MTPVFELAAFTVRDGHEQALLDERPVQVRAGTALDYAERLVVSPSRATPGPPCRSAATACSE